MSYIEIIGCLFGLFSAYLLYKQSTWGWPVGIINVMVFMVMFYNQKLYPSFLLHVIFLVLWVYGWLVWAKTPTNKTTKNIPVTKITKKELWGVLIFVPTMVFLIGSWFFANTKMAFPYTDSTIMVISIVAQWLLSRKVLENFIFWIISDLIAIPLYIYREMYYVAGLYLVYLIICVFAYRSWKKEAQA